SNAVLASIINSFNNVGPDIYESLVDEQGDPNALNLTSNRFFYQQTIQSKYPDYGMVDWLQRPLDEIRYNDSRSTATDLRLNGGVRYSFLEHFRLDANFQYLSGQLESEKYYAPESYYVRDLYNRFSQLPSPFLPNTPVSHPVPLGG